jgi:polysaccharide deacetylase family protein (PEP-CTERM system associated)
LAAGGDRPTLLLSVDFEDWHQLVRRRVGAAGWAQPGPALPAQTHALLDLLDELGARATFFVLGMAARAHPELLHSVVERGHEIGSHGDAHLPVNQQSPAEFAADLRAARETIEQITGRVPHGYRAPAFSIKREAGWAYTVLAEEGFDYDASQHDSPRIRGRMQVGDGGPHPLELGGGRVLWEFPVAVWRGRRGRLPVGGASYWGVMPRAVTLHGLAQAGRFAGLYLHPHEFDPHPLRAHLEHLAPTQRAHAALRAAQRNAARRRAPATLRAIAGRFALIPYGEAYAELNSGAAART